MTSDCTTISFTFFAVCAHVLRRWATPPVLGARRRKAMKEEEEQRERNGEWAQEDHATCFTPPCTGVHRYTYTCSSLSPSPLLIHNVRLCKLVRYTRRTLGHARHIRSSTLSAHGADEALLPAVLEVAGDADVVAELRS